VLGARDAIRWRGAAADEEAESCFSWNAGSAEVRARRGDGSV
jgi:hypothetical protein